MRTLTQAQKDALLAPHARIETRVYVARNDGRTWADFTRVPDGRGGVSDRVLSATLDEDVDRRTLQLTLTLVNPAGEPSLSPEDEDSELNYFNGVFDPLLTPARECQVWVAVTDGTPPAEGDFQCVFHGYLGADIRPAADGTLSLTVNDLAKRLQVAFLLAPRTYPAPDSNTPAPIEQIMQQILDQELGTGTVTLYCLTASGARVPVTDASRLSPAVSLSNVTVAENRSVWDALQELAQTVGWDLRYLYDPADGKFKLTFREPPRSTDMATATPALVLNESFVQDEQPNISDASLRNYVAVRYFDPATGQTGEVVREDTVSQGAYWKRPMLVTGNERFPVKTATHAGILADAILYDLRDLDRTTEVTCRAIPWLEIYDVVRLGKNRVRSAPKNVAVLSFTHTFGRGQWQTQFTAHGKVRGAVLRWLSMETRPGAPGKPPDIPETRVIPNAPANLRLIASGLETVEQVTLAYLDLAWDAVTNLVCDQYVFRWRKVGTGNWESKTVLQGTASAPQRIGGLPGNVAYEIQVAGISRAGVQGAWSNTLSVTTPKDTQAPPTPATPTVTGIIRGIRVSVPRPAIPDWKLTRVRVKSASGGAAMVTAEGAQTEFEITAGLTAGQTYWADAQYEDTSGNVSGWSPEASAVAGTVQGNDIASAFEVRDDANNLLFKIEKPTGNAWFKGSVEAREFILPVRSA